MKWRRTTALITALIASTRCIETYAASSSRRLLVDGEFESIGNPPMPVPMPVPMPARDFSTLGRAVTKHLPAPFWTKDAEGRYTGVNDYFTRVFGFDVAGAVIGKTDEELVEAATVDLSIDEFDDVLPNETFKSIWGRLRDNDIIVQESGEPTRFLERIFLRDEKRVIPVNAIKAPYMGGTVGIAVFGHLDEGITLDLVRDDDEMSIGTSDDTDAEAVRIESLGRAAVQGGAFLLWTKDANGRYTALNDFYLDYVGAEDESDVLGKTDLDIVAVAAPDGIDDYEGLLPGETSTSIANSWYEDDLRVIESNETLRVIERDFNDGRVFDVISIKAPFAGGTVGVAIPVDASDASDVVNAVDVDA